MKCRHNKTACSLCDAKGKRAFGRLKRAWHDPAVVSSEERDSAMKEPHKHRTVACCKNGHSWNCLWWAERISGPILTGVGRRVEPECCITCGDPWDTVRTESDGSYIHEVRR